MVAFFTTPNERERDVRMIAHSAAAAIAVSCSALPLLSAPATTAATDIDCCGVLVRVCIQCTQ